jgi:hypothetical protein
MQDVQAALGHFTESSLVNTVDQDGLLAQNKLLGDLLFKCQ